MFFVMKCHLFFAFLASSGFPFFSAPKNPKKVQKSVSKTSALSQKRALVEAFHLADDWGNRTNWTVEGRCAMIAGSTM
jgi:hypothetical protein